MLSSTASHMEHRNEKMIEMEKNRSRSESIAMSF